MEPPATKDRENFLEGMRYTASAVNIVTTDGSAGKAGVTVSAMTPVSADGDQPTLLVCVHHLSPACQAILENKVFGVSILSQKQSFIADTFAGRIKAMGDDKFSCTEWINGKTGVPLVLNSLVSFECKVLENTRVGSHHVFIGGVQNTRFQKDELPLIYSNRAYGSPSKIALNPNPDQEDRGASLLRIGCIAPLSFTFLPELLAEFLSGRFDLSYSVFEGSEEQLLQYLASGTCDIAFLNNLPSEDYLNEHILTQLNHYVFTTTSNSKINPPGPFTLEMLVELPLLHLESSLYPDIFDLFRSKGLTPKIKVQSTSLEVILDMVEKGLGYTVLAALSSNQPQIQNRKLYSSKLPGPVGNLVIAIPKKSSTSSMARHFYEFSKQYFML